MRYCALRSGVARTCLLVTGWLPRHCPRFLALLSFVLLSFGVATTPAAERELLQELRAGGYNLYFRHMATEWSQSDHIREAGDWRSCDPGRVRQLSGAGRDQAVTVGEAMRQLRIPVGEVLASPYCRTVESARLMGLGEVRETIAVMNLRSADFVGGRASVIASTRALLANVPASGNRVIVAHGNVAREATPAYPGEGEALVFEPQGEHGFRLVGRIAIEDWARLQALDAQ